MVFHQHPHVLHSICAVLEIGGAYDSTWRVVSWKDVAALGEKITTCLREVACRKCEGELGNGPLFEVIPPRPAARHGEACNFPTILGFMFRVSIFLAGRT